jgi:hypothetical protein
MADAAITPTTADPISRYFGNMEIARGQDVGFKATNNGKVPSGAKSVVENYAKVSNRVGGDNAVISAARDAAFGEESAYMTKKYLNYRRKQIKAGLDLYGNCADFVIDAMRAAETAGMIDTRFGRMALRHNLNMSSQTAEVSGYEAAHNEFMTTMGD